ncbi:U3 small nucleolar RNA-associated protein 18 homolog [Anopheles maculipalpis]|uniref:U3 small nucleolar RNA-associated protein 18 homolog n=1 Tax=Anopheles maculipalpis TaxID=1496333 RepID=UPI002159978F|nr:U3 small nucleolar RNA-associated protein 18 homolog [Anopheles maculipalpis]
MTMESEDEFDHLSSSHVSNLRNKKGFQKQFQRDDESSSEEEASIKLESDTEQEGQASAAADRTFSDDLSIKSEPESLSDDDSNVVEKNALISSYVNALKSKMGYTDESDESSNEEDDVSFKSESETEDELPQPDPEPDQDSDADKEQTMENIERDTTGTSPKANNPEGVQDKPKKGKMNLKKKLDEQRTVKPEEELMSKLKTKVPKKVRIDLPKSKMEKELMSLVFGGKAALVSELTNESKEKQPKTETSTKVTQPQKPGDKSTAKRSAIWHDSDDDDEEDSSNIKRNKFSREELPEQLTNERRRKQFEQLVGKPKWADLDRDRDLDSDDEILQKVGHVVKGTASQGLPKGMIELKKLKNLNRETKAEGEITGINFHPTSMVAIMTGKRGLVSIVTVDGVRNEKLHTIWLPKMRVVCSSLSPDGSEATFGSYRKFYHVYNLMSGRSDTLKIPERETWMMKNYRVSRCGKYLASAGECGEVHLMSAKSKEVLQTIQLRYPCQSLSFTPDSRYLLCHSNDTEVTVFSLEQKRIVNVFQDDGCVNGSCIAVCPNGQFVATGSRQGVVNIYRLDVTLSQKQPVPLKTINNLTTYIDSLSFNVTSELLAIASSTVKNAVKLIHVKSTTVFRNFPLPMTNMGHITTVEFSPSGGYLALGTKESTVLLFRVKHYPNY